MSRRSSRRRPVRALGRLFVLLVTAWLACLAAILVWSRRSSTESADAIIVMGAAQYGGRPSPVLEARLDHAIALWKAKRAPLVIFTGGLRTGDVVSEAAAGRRFAMRRGVSARAILLEGSGHTSLASMHGAAVLLKQHRDSITSAPVYAAKDRAVKDRAVKDRAAKDRAAKDRAALDTALSDSTDAVPVVRPRVLLVSDPFHMLRLDLLARMHGLTPLPSPTQTSPISAKPSVAWEYMLRESIALPADVLLLLWLHVRGHSTDAVAQG